MYSQIHLQQSYLDRAIHEVYATYVLRETNLAIHYAHKVNFKLLLK